MPQELRCNRCDNRPFTDKMQGKIFALWLLILSPLVSASEIEVEINWDGEINKMWVDMATDSDDVSVTRLFDTEFDKDCANSALRMAKSDLARVHLAVGAWESFLISIDLIQDVLSLGGYGTVADFLEITVGILDGWPDSDEMATNFGEFVAKKAAGTATSGAAQIWDQIEDGDLAAELSSILASKIAGHLYSKLTEDTTVFSKDCVDSALGGSCPCSPVQVRFWVTAIEPNVDSESLEIELENGGTMDIAGFRLNMRVRSVSCACKYPVGLVKAQQLDSFSVSGSVPLGVSAELDGEKVQLTLAADGPYSYEVNAECCKNVGDDSRTKDRD